MNGSTAEEQSLFVRVQNKIFKLEDNSFVFNAFHRKEKVNKKLENPQDFFRGQSEDVTYENEIDRRTAADATDFTRLLSIGQALSEW